jgi:predicted PurR-regulated permease PerM
VTNTVDSFDHDSRPPPWVRRAILIWWATGAVLWIGYFLARELRSLLIQIVLALFLSFAIEPIVDALEQRRVRRGVATGIALIGVIAAFLAFIAAMGTLIADQLDSLITQLPNDIVSAQEWLDSTFGIQVSANDLIDQVRPGGQASEFVNNLAGNLLSFGTTLANVLFQILTVLLFTYYFAADGPRLRRHVCSLFPPSRQHEILRVWELAVNKTGAYISSRLILAIISGLFHWVVFSILGLPSAVALAAWVGVISQFIPAIGTYLAGILPLLVALGVDPAKAIWVLIAIVSYQQIENYVLQPRVTAQTLDMHPAVAIGAVLAGTSLFGVAGAFLALPVVATLTGFSTAYIQRHEVVDYDPVQAAAVGAEFRRRATDRHPNERRDSAPTAPEPGTDDADDGFGGS